MDDKYAAESKFLAKNYKAFLYDFLYEVKMGKGEVHIAPPPAFRHVYDMIIGHAVDVNHDEVDYRDLIYMMDQVAKFVSYLNKHGIEYDHFAESPTTTLTDEDLILLLEGGGEKK